MMYAFVMHKTNRWQYRVMGLALAATLASTGARGADPVGPTDAQVVGAMQKGIDFLLSQKQVDNWELRFDGPYKPKGNGAWPGMNYGGETSIVVYALLHAQQSLRDNEEYHEKLRPLGPDMGPCITWLSKLEAKATYTAGLQASALALTKKKQDDDGLEGPKAGLNRVHDYLLMAMGQDGGYAYNAPGSNGVESFADAWQEYIDLKAGNPSADAVNKAAQKVMEHAKALSNGFGGAQVGVLRIESNIRARGVRATAAKDIAALKRLDFEIKELGKLRATLPKANPALPGLQQGVVNARNDILKAQANIRAGTRDEWQNNKIVKVAKTPKELAVDLENAQKRYVDAEFKLKNDFAPIGDLSNGQYGVLGGWALDDYGIEIRTDYWKAQDHFWRMLQHADGGWSYSTNMAEDSRPTMSLAGIASLFITREFVETELRLVPKPDKNIEAGMAWLNKNFSAGGDLYYLYGVERVGLSSGRKFFGTTDWYRAGALNLVKWQAANGSWNYQDAVVGTAYALLFLARGRNPILFNKLEYAGPWDARPQDDANITHWISKQFETPLNWQSINLKVKPEEWLDAPILLITGSQDPKFGPDDIAKLKAYIDAGGLIFSTTDGGARESKDAPAPAKDAGGKDFTEAMRKYAGLATGGKYEMRELPATHPIFTKELWADIKDPPRMLGMSNGLRDVWIHSTADLGASWHMRRIAKNPDDFAVATNIYFYATGKATLQSKLASIAVGEPEKKPTRVIQMARIDHVGNADPEPGAWPRMVRIAAATFNTDLQLTTTPWAKLDPKTYKIAHMTGSTRFTLTDADVAALKAYLDGGGLLFADAAAGSTAFGESFEALMRKVYPNTALSTLPNTHPIITGELPDAMAIPSIKFRKYGEFKLGIRPRTANLSYMKPDDRITVIYSQYDITSGLLGTNTWGIVGYAPESAAALVRNILLFASAPPVKPTTTSGPATSTAPATGPATQGGGK